LRSSPDSTLTAVTKENFKLLIMLMFALKWAGIIMAAWSTLGIAVAAIYAAMNYDKHRREEEFQRLGIDEFACHRLTREKWSLTDASLTFAEHHGRVESGAETIR